MNYIDNDEFSKVLANYKKNQDVESYNRLGELFSMVAERLLYSSKFINYSPDYKDEMYSEAIYNCIRYFRNFDPQKNNNPFGYFTKVVWMSFIFVLNKEKKIRENRSNLKEKVYNTLNLTISEETTIDKDE